MPTILALQTFTRIYTAQSLNTGSGITRIWIPDVIAQSHQEPFQAWEAIAQLAKSSQVFQEGAYVRRPTSTQTTQEIS